MSRMIRFTVLFLVMGLLVGGTALAADSVTFWTQYATQPWLDEVISDFTEQTGISVDVRQISYNTDEIFTAIAADAAPDLFTHGLASLGAIASLDVLRPLDTYIDRWNFAGEIVPQGLAAGLYQGRQYALPFSGIAVRDLIYRSDAFEEAGFGAENPPQHWEDLVEYGSKLVRTSADGQLTRSALVVTASEQTFSMFLHQSGSQLFTDERSLLDSPEARAALEFHVGLVHQHGLHLPGFAGNADILTGKTTMVWADALYWMRAREGREQLRVATFPYSKQPATFLGTGIMAIPTRAKNADGALKLAEFILHPDRQRVINYGTGQLPFYRTAAEWDWVRDTPVLAHFLEAVSYAVPNPAHEKWFDIRTVLNNAVTSAFNQEQSPTNALLQAHQQVQALLDQAR